MAYDRELAERIRTALSGQDDVREVSMFGGLSFMVNDKIAVTANTQGQLMVRCDPDRVNDLLGETGADWAEMRGRQMSKGWLVVSPEGRSSDDDLGFWIGQALDYNQIATK